jgi:hypothetical protein
MRRLGWPSHALDSCLDVLATPPSSKIAPVAGEPLVFTEFSGEPQCFLGEAQLNTELRRVGFVPDPMVLFHEYNLPKPGHL